MLIIRCHEVFANTEKHPLPQITVYGGDRLTTLQQWEAKLKIAGNFATEIRFSSADSLTAARQCRRSLIDKAETIAIVNFANRWQKGGVAYAPYGGSQEEFLARRSNMSRKENFEEVHRQLAKIRSEEGYDPDEHFYHHIPYFGAVHASAVTFIVDKDGVSKPTEFDPFDTIWTAAVDNRKNSNEALHLQKRCKENAENARRDIMKNKIKAIFNTAIEKNNLHLILGAYGCGCFDNKDQEVATIFKELLNKEYHGCFKTITFSITEQTKLNIFQSITN